MDIAIDRSEICRYMGIKGSSSEEATERLIEEAIEAVKRVACPRFAFREASFSLENDAVIFQHQTVKSHDLFEYFQNCVSAVAFIATLGSEVDRLIFKDSLLHPSRALAEQATATALLEAYCDIQCKEIGEQFISRGLHLKPRFSPGYGDCSLESQTALLGFLNAYKRVGVSLTDRWMMTPTKSVSAWIGVSKHEIDCHKKGCVLCEKVDCEFRKRGRI